MKLKNIICTIFAAFSLLAFSGISAYADTIAEPDNSFYRNNYKNCEYIHWRTYEVNEDSSLLRSPLRDNISGYIKKGETVSVGFTYTDEAGVVWGCCSFWKRLENERSKDGWVEMTKLSEIYNVFTFLDEHESELIDYSGELDEYIPK